MADAKVAKKAFFTELRPTRLSFWVKCNLWGKKEQNFKTDNGLPTSLLSKVKWAISSCSVTRNLCAGVLYFKHGVFSCGNCCQFVGNSRSLENFIDTSHYKKVVPESRFLGSCCRNGGATNVCRYHSSDVKNGVDWKQKLCLILSKNSGCILFLIFSPLLRLASKHNSHCSR